MAATGLSIGQVADRTGLSVDTLRFYEREDLLPTPVRRYAGRRAYTDDDVEWLTICVNLRASGMPVAQIRRYTHLVRAGTGNEVERLAILREHQSRVTAQIAALTASLTIISNKVAVYEQHLDNGTADTLWSGPAPA